MSINLKTKIAGVTFENRVKFISELKQNDTVFLEREPCNSYDSNAIKVMDFQNRQLGYINKIVAVDLSQLIDEGACFDVKVTDLNEWEKPDGKYLIGVEITINQLMNEDK